MAIRVFIFLSAVNDGISNAISIQPKIHFTVSPNNLVRMSCSRSPGIMIMEWKTTMKSCVQFVSGWWNLVQKSAVSFIYFVFMHPSFVLIYSMSLAHCTMNIEHAYFYQFTDEDANEEVKKCVVIFFVIATVEGISHSLKLTSILL